MACKDCGQQAVPGGPCRTFTFPLGNGSVELLMRGHVTKADVGPLRALLGFVLDLLSGTLPEATKEQGETRGGPG